MRLQRHDGRLLLTMTQQAAADRAHDALHRDRVTVARRKSGIRQNLVAPIRMAAGALAETTAAEAATDPLQAAALQTPDRAARARWPTAR
jgi:hypothetical protein